MTSENFDEKMMQRALGLVEGIAFGLGEGTRDVLLGAAEDIDSGIKALEKRAEGAEKEHGEDQLAIRGFLRSVDELRTENTRLRDMLEKMATEEAATAGDDDEIATSATPPRNDKVGGPDEDVSGCAGENFQAENGCAVCKGYEKLFGSGGTAVWVKGRRLRVETAGFVHSSAIAFCPKCGRKL